MTTDLNAIFSRVFYFDAILLKFVAVDSTHCNQTVQLIYSSQIYVDLLYISYQNLF